MARYAMYFQSVTIPPPLKNPEGEETVANDTGSEGENKRLVRVIIVVVAF